MPCPNCNSHNLWDDNLWWGCHECHFMSDSICNTGSKHDRFISHNEYEELVEEKQNSGSKKESYFFNHSRV